MFDSRTVEADRDTKWRGPGDVRIDIGGAELIADLGDKVGAWTMCYALLASTGINYFPYYLLRDQIYTTIKKTTWS